MAKWCPRHIDKFVSKVITQDKDGQKIEITEDTNHYCVCDENCGLWSPEGCKETENYG